MFKQKQAIQYGAGNIGRGFIGKILSDAGYLVTFGDVNKAIIEQLNNKQQYVVEVCGEHKKQELVKNINALLSDSQEFINLIAHVEIITTAVGPNILKFIAPILAKGIQKKIAFDNRVYLNIIACENMINGSATLKQEVIKHLSQDEIMFLDKYVGFPNSAVDRIVPPFSDLDITKVVVEEFSEWIVEKKDFKGDLPKIKGMELVDNLEPFIERKLFTLNTGHTLCAYYGHIKKYKYIGESINDSQIKHAVESIMKETGNVLIKKYHLDKEKHYQYISKIISRFQNPYIVDEIKRVAREPIRKLGFNERFTKPAIEAYEFGFENKTLLFAIACALLYLDQSDQQSISLQEKIKSLGLRQTIIEATSINIPELIDQIEKNYYLLNK